MASRDEANEASEGGGSGRIAMGLALAVAFSPVLVDLARHLWEAPWARGALVFPWLLWLASRIDRPSAKPAGGNRIVLVAVVLALVFQLAAIGGDAVRIARLGVVLALAVGFWAYGLLGVRASMLALWILPVPSAVLNAFRPALETAMARAVDTLSVASFVPTSGGPLLETARGPLPLTGVDGGVALGVGLAGLGWAAGVLRDTRLSVCARQALIGGALGAPLQLSLVVVASTVVATQAGVGEARTFLDHVGGAIIVLAGLALPRWILRRGTGGDAKAGEEAVPC